MYAGNPSAKSTKRIPLYLFRLQKLYVNELWITLKKDARNT